MDSTGVREHWTRGAAGGEGTGPWGAYVHVPFCARRCGYCDFNTYVPRITQGPESETLSFAKQVEAAIDLWHAVLPPRRPFDTVFFGGGTPTLLPAAHLVRVLQRLRSRWGLAPDAEVTTEANPDTVTHDYLAELRAGGFTRVSLGMQSSVPSVLATLDRTHRVENVGRAVAAARAAGLAVSLDLIYGTPGETLDQWADSLRAAVRLGPDHVSAYALTVEPGTSMGARVRRGELPLPEDDDEADKYELADDVLSGAGYAWYEISNWARRPADRCRHNLGYWSGGQWLAVGPGAHGLVAGVRWWEHKLPRTWQESVRAGELPIAGAEVLTPADVDTERVLLGIRTVHGLGLDEVRPGALPAVPGLVDSGLLQPGPAAAGRAVLTRRGRLLADTVVRALV